MLNNLRRSYIVLNIYKLSLLIHFVKKLIIDELCNLLKIKLNRLFYRKKMIIIQTSIIFSSIQMINMLNSLKVNDM